MELMLKPSLKCNFNCDFCSAGLFKQKDQPFVDEKLKSVINEINPDIIYVTGGDPLLLPLSYFDELLSINDKVTLSLTSNMLCFLNNPSKYVELFNNHRVDVSTSFQYGSRRKLATGEIYTEEMFRKVFNLFKEVTGKPLTFISIISKENEDKALDHVYLAKELDTSCKLNGMLPIGKSTEYYPRYKMIEIYLKIIELGLEKYEETVRTRKEGNCPFNTAHLCNSGNRSVIINQDGKYLYNFCEDLIMKNEYVDSLEKIDSCFNIDTKNLINNSKCLTCNLFNICNACTLHRQVAKNDKTYCENMKKYEDILEEKGFKL